MCGETEGCGDKGREIGCLVFCGLQFRLFGDDECGSRSDSGLSETDLLLIGGGGGVGGGVGVGEVASPLPLHLCVRE